VKKKGPFRTAIQFYVSVWHWLARRDVLLIVLALAAGAGGGIVYQSAHPIEVLNKNLCAFEYGGQFYIPKLDDS
jgi:hypothetical protein